MIFRVLDERQVFLAAVTVAVGLFHLFLKFVDGSVEAPGCNHDDCFSVADRGGTSVVP